MKAGVFSIIFVVCVYGILYLLGFTHPFEFPFFSFIYWILIFIGCIYVANVLSSGSNSTEAQEEDEVEQV